MELSKRLKTVAGMITEGHRLADIGTDHAYVPIALCRRGIIPSAIAMDVNPGPLQRAREHIHAYQLEEKIQVRLSDGLKELSPGEVDTILIAGMGGLLTVRILENGKHLLSSDKTDTSFSEKNLIFMDPSDLERTCMSSSGESDRPVRELVLQPQSDIREVRKWLMENGWRIAEEHAVLEDGKYYPMLRAVPRETTDDHTDLSKNIPEESSAWWTLTEFFHRLSETEKNGKKDVVRIAEQSCGNAHTDHVLNNLSVEERTELALRFGPLLLLKHPEELLPMLDRETEIQLQVLKSINTGKSRKSAEKMQARKLEVEMELRLLSEAKMICAVSRIL